jgi:uncharacterized protein YpmS
MRNSMSEGVSMHWQTEERIWKWLVISGAIALIILFIIAMYLSYLEQQKEEIRMQKIQQMKPKLEFKKLNTQEQQNEVIISLLEEMIVSIKDVRSRLNQVSAISGANLGVTMARGPFR